ncbi:MAG TPA: FHA domain-containing protein [Saprospiraceae bacterium]|jgi:hypothetical protein|nr:FHA domain-containing protein [Saprospiraceae bacterium]
MILTLGTDKSNDIVIENPELKPHHFDVKVINDDIIHLTDVTNTYTTKVNDSVIVSARIKRNQKLCIGKYTPDTNTFFENILSKYRQKKTDFTEEFISLMEQFRQYQKRKDQINKTPVGPIIARASVTIITMALIYMAPFANGENRILFMSASGVVAMIIGSFFSPSNAKRNEKLDKLLLEYEHILVCPKCNSKMIYQSYTYWQGKKRCINDKCNAVYQH